MISIFTLVVMGTGWSEVIGKSVRGRRIEAFSYGKGTETILYVGGIHGDEGQGVEILNRFRRVVSQNPSLYKGVRVVLVPLANPDGYRKRSRVNARGVDINRNFPTRNYTTNYTKSPYYPGLKPASEPETKALMRLVQKYKPSLVVTVHSQLHCIMVEGDALWYAQEMQFYNHYPVVTNLGYDTPGSLGDYCGERGIPVITIEVPRIPVDALWQQNALALRVPLKFPPSRLAMMWEKRNTKKNPSLLEAIQRPDWYLLQSRYTNAREWQQLDEEGNSALHLAIRTQNTPLALQLIERGFHLNTSNKKGRSPLFEAAYEGNEQVVGELLKRGVSPNQRDAKGWTPLIAAAQQGNSEVVRLLLEAGAFVDEQDEYGYTALMEAVRTQRKVVVSLLLSKGANPSLTNRYGQTASRQAMLARSTNVLLLLGGGK